MSNPFRARHDGLDILDDVRCAPPDLPAAPPDIQCVLREVHARLFDPELSVESIRARCRSTNHNLSSRFALHLGVGIRGYIERERLEAACQLLLRTSARVYEIAEAIGYTYVETFERAFIRQVGVSPAAYRSIELATGGQTDLETDAKG